MKQIFKKVLITLTLFSSLNHAFESDLYSFIGVQGSSSKYDDLSTPTIALKYGQQNSSWRTAISLNYAQTGDDRLQALIAQVDHGVLTDMFDELPIKPYIGFSLGVINHQNSKNSIDSDSGYLYGANGGINYVLNSDFDIDLGYRYLKTDKLEYIDYISDITLSLHYYFE